MSAVVVYVFHGVGQGLFTSGSLGTLNSLPRFRWVYDCGTSSKQRFVRDQISALAYSDPAKRDLLFLSHFDKDHVSGVTKLIEAVGAWTVVLPYIPLWRRLLIAFDEDLSAGDALMGFYRNPAAYLSGLENGPDRVIFVGPGAVEGGEPGPPREPPAGPLPRGFEGAETETDRGELKTDIDRDLDDTDPETRADIEAMRQSSRAGVELLRRGGGLYALGLWEFVPYNDPSTAPSKEEFADFVDDVNASSEALIAGTSTQTGEDPVKALERSYDTYIGKKNRNKGSLFVYAGPLGRPDVAFLQFLTDRWSELDFFPPGRCSLLLTGDGDLSGDHAFDLLRQHLGRERMGRIDVLQVMHHGSRKNSKPGRAKDIAPSFSVFCANPDDRRYNHPDGEVVRDFLRYRPILVDQNRSLRLDYLIEWR